MRIVNKEIKVYKFKELAEDIQYKIINEEVNFIAETTDFGEISKNSNLYRAYRDCEEMQTPWFIGEYIWDYCKKDILKRLNKYEYEADGKYFHE